MSNDLKIKGYFINLDRATDRRLKMEAQISKYNLSTYERFPAIDAREKMERAGRRILRDGEIAIFESHLQLFRKAAKTNTPIHILEDDAVFSKYFKKYLEFALKSELFSVFDVIFTSMIPKFDFVTLRNLKRISVAAFSKQENQLEALDFSLSEAHDYYHLGMESYIVNNNSIPKIAATLEEYWKNGEPQLPVDKAIRAEIRSGRLRAACVLPFLTTVSLDDVLNTQSERDDDALPMSAMGLIRSMFFADRDLPELQAAADKIVAEAKSKAEVDAHDAILHKLLTLI